MALATVTDAKPSKEKPAKGRNEFGYQPSLFSRMIQRTCPTRRVTDLLRFAMHQDPSGIEWAQAKSAAVKALNELKPKKQKKALRKAQRLLLHVGSEPFAHQEQTHYIYVIASFFEKAAQYLEKNERGNRDNSSLKYTINTLRDAAEEKESPEHQVDPKLINATRLSCVRALWQLEYGNPDFWKSMVRDPVTCDTAVKELLEHEDDVEFEKHGWYLLRGELKDSGIAISIARHSSKKKTDFLLRMLDDKSPAVVRNVLRSAMYLQDTPDDFYEIAKEIVNDEEEQKTLRTEASEFLEVKKLWRKVKSDTSRKFTAALALIQMRKKRNYLHKMVESLTYEMGRAVRVPQGKTKEAKALYQLNALYLLSRLYGAGYEMKGQTRPAPEAIDNLLNKPEAGWKLLRHDLAWASRYLGDCKSDQKVAFLAKMLGDNDSSVVRNAFAAARKVYPVPQEFIASANAILDDPAKLEMHDRALRFLEAYYVNMVKDRSFGRKKEYRRLLKDLKKMIGSGTAREMYLALNAAVHLRSVPQDIMDLTYDILKDPTKIVVWPQANALQLTGYDKLARSNTDPARKVETVRKLIESGDPGRMHKGLTTASLLDVDAESQKELYALADSVLASEHENLWEAADDVARIHRLWKNFGSYDGQFEAARDLMELYAGGRIHLKPMLIEIGNDLIDVMRDPSTHINQKGADGEVTRVPRHPETVMGYVQCAKYLVLKLTTLGFGVGRINVDLSDVIDENLTYPTPKGQELLLRDLHMVVPLVIESGSDNKVELLGDAVQSERPETVVAGLAIADQLEVIPTDFIELVYERLEKAEGEHLRTEIGRFLDNYHISRARGASESGLEELKEMLADDNPAKVKNALRALVHFEDPELSRKFSKIVNETLNYNEQSEEIRTAIREFHGLLFIRSDLSSYHIDIAAEAAGKLIDMYTSDPHSRYYYLTGLLMEAAEELDFCLKDPKSLTGDIGYKKAIGVMAKLGTLGIIDPPTITVQAEEEGKGMTGSLKNLLEMIRAGRTPTEIMKAFGFKEDE